MRGPPYELRASRLGQDTVSLVATADGSVRSLYWFVDSGFVGEAAPSAPLPWSPVHAGEFALSVVDDRGSSDTRTVRVGLVP